MEKEDIKVYVKKMGYRVKQYYEIGSQHTKKFGNKGLMRSREKKNYSFATLVDY